MNASPDESGRNVDWPSPRAEQLPRFFDPESPGGWNKLQYRPYASRRMGGRIPLIPQNKLGWQQQQ
uniref:Uncharacterized protein n=1 Tax=Pyricularia oryzae (strain P131) TaxID=1143193 RepID=L7J137_PYRO1